jgi:hypothetical protein
MVSALTSSYFFSAPTVKAQAGPVYVEVNVADGTKVVPSGQVPSGRVGRNPVNWTRNACGASLIKLTVASLDDVGVVTAGARQYDWLPLVTNDEPAGQVPP